jgi:glyoxylase-like metal-dependent hydrolase (beta-lactamase superfamily II)
MEFILGPARREMPEMRKLERGILRSVFFQPFAYHPRTQTNPVPRVSFYLAAEQKNKIHVGQIKIMTIVITKFVTGPIDTNTYVVSNERGACLIVDPSRGCNEVLDHARKNGLDIESIVLTHGHFDHILGIAEIHDAHPAIDVWMHPGDKCLVANAERNGASLIGSDFSLKILTRDLIEGPSRIGSFDCDVAHIPGHTPGGCAFIFEGACLSGDSLFAGSIGRTDFPGCDGEALIKNIKEKLFRLPDETVVYPGHGGRTTIGREKRLNPFLRR